MKSDLKTHDKVKTHKNIFQAFVTAIVQAFVTYCAEECGAGTLTGWWCWWAPLPPSGLQLPFRE